MRKQEGRMLRGWGKGGSGGWRWWQCWWQGRWPTPRGADGAPGEASATGGREGVIFVCCVHCYLFVLFCFVLFCVCFVFCVFFFCLFYFFLLLGWSVGCLNVALARFVCMCCVVVLSCWFSFLVSSSFVLFTFTSSSFCFPPVVFR